MTAPLVAAPLYLRLVTSEPGGAGALVRIQAERVDASGELRGFDSFARAERLTMMQSRLIGVSNAQLDDAPELDEALGDLLGFAEGCTDWIVAFGDEAREALTRAASKVGFARFPGPGLVGLDDLAALVLPTSAHRDLSALLRELDPKNADTFDQDELSLLQAVHPRLEARLLALPLPVLSEMNWMLAKTGHPLSVLLKRAENAAVQEQFSDTFHSGKVAYEKLFKDFSAVIDQLRPEDGTEPDDLSGEKEDEEEEKKPDGHEPLPLSRPQVLIDEEEIRTVMGPTGALGKALQGYEERPEQVTMAEQVGEAFNQGRHLLVEAGTGVGKSLAYLAPAVLYAARSRRPIMISTHTKNLQSQLYDKDIPFLKQNLGVNFNAAILRGRSNYLCVRKLMYTMQEASHELESDERGAMLPVLSWAVQTESGDVNELTAYSPEQKPALWDRLHTVGEDCLKRACPFFKRCFVYKARGLARTADVVVINHALVFSALNQEAGALPAYDEIVFDEAHKLEDVATDHLACEIAPRRIQKVLGRLFRAGPSGAGKGLLPSLLAHLEQARSEFQPDLFDRIRTHAVDAMQALQPAGAGSDLFFDIVRAWTEKPPEDDEPVENHVPIERGRADRARAPFRNAPFKGKRKGGGDERKRYAAQQLKPEETEALRGGKESVIASLAGLRKKLNVLEEDFPDIRKRRVARSRELLQEISAQNLFLQELIQDIEFVMKGDEPNYVYWGERWGRRGARMVAAPLEIGALLFDQLYEKKRSIIFASATLSVRDSHSQGAGLTPYKFATPPVAQKAPVGQTFLSASSAPVAGRQECLPHQTISDSTPHPKSFEFLKLRFGLSLCSPQKLHELLLGSPFDYRTQCRLCVPTFLPEPGGGREADYTKALSEMIARLSLISGGRALVLYTSYSALEASAALLRPALAAEGIDVLSQGRDGSRENLLAWLKSGGRKILLGTASFWEGVDVRGDALSLLVIAKLPFAVFTDPIVQGRCELLEAAGKDPFLHFSVPNAILKLRQGFGRLIRSRIDKGMVILADKRVITKRYGAAFLRALPAQAQTVASLDALCAVARDVFEA